LRNWKMRLIWAATFAAVKRNKAARLGRLLGEFLVACCASFEWSFWWSDEDEKDLREEQWMKKWERKEEKRIKRKKEP